MSVMHKNRRNPILLGQDNNALTWLLIINAVVFVAINFIKIIYFLSYETQTEALQNFNLQILYIGRFLKVTLVKWHLA